MNFKSGDGPFAKIAHIALYVSRYKHLIRIWYLGTSRGAPISISGGRRSFHWPATRNSYSCLPSAARRHPRNLSRSSRSIWKMLKMRPDLWFFSAVIKHSTDLGQRTFFFFFFGKPAGSLIRFRDISRMNGLEPNHFRQIKLALSRIKFLCKCPLLSHCNKNKIRRKVILFSSNNFIARMR